MKKQFSFLLVLVASTTFSHAAIVNGTCGANLTWSLDTKDSTLTIEGSGDMDDYNDYESLPWYEYVSYIAHINLPNGLTRIGKYGCSVCHNLTSIEIPNSVTSIGNYAFYNTDHLVSLSIPNSVTSIGERAFYYCDNLASIELSNTLTKLSRGLFSFCSLTSVEIPNSVTVIEEYAFAQCSHLTSVAIGNGVASIGNQAFNSGTVTSLTILATTPPSGGAGSGVNAGNCTLYVPAEAVEAYSNAVWWEDFKQIKAIGDGIYTVNFMSWNGQLLARRFVESGHAAVAPTAPTREGYTFTGWDKDFSNVTSDLTVTAQYEEWQPTNYTFLFLNGTDNSLIGSSHVDFTLPNPPAVAGFTFSKWFVVAGEFDNQIVFIAVYEYTGVPTVAPAEVPVPGSSAQKLIREGNVYILTDDAHTYSMKGQKVQ